MIGINIIFNVIIVYFLNGEYMRIIGKLCSRVDTIDGKKEFTDFYNIDPYQYIFEYELFHVSHLMENEF